MWEKILKYIEAPDIKILVEEIVQKLEFSHIDVKSVFCFRSKGSKSNRIVARIHGFSKIWQKALGLSSGYIIEVLSERYDKLSQENKEKTIIHELLHIPKGFKGGFRPHKGYVSRKKVDTMFLKYKKIKKS